MTKDLLSSENLQKPGALRIKRIYEPPGEADGFRTLVDRLWPRGISKDAAMLDEWAKDAAPSPGLRKWFGHSEERFPEFSELYRMELEQNPAADAFANKVRENLSQQNVTLLYAAKSETCNHALVLREWLLYHWNTAQASGCAREAFLV